MKKELKKTKGVFVKKSKMSLAKSTTALTCLIGSLIIVSSDLVGAQTTTATGSMAVATNIARTCTISATTMSFDPYTGSATPLTKTSDITINCTNGVNYSISLNATAESSPDYYLYLGGTVTNTDSDRLKVRFTHTGGTITGATTAITGTGIGATQTSILTGTLAASQTGKTAGDFTRTFILNLVY
jgi:spore coat protein U-like protein